MSRRRGRVRDRIRDRVRRSARSGFGVGAPLVSVVLVVDRPVEGVAESMAALLDQDHASLELLVPAGLEVGPDDRVRPVSHGADPVAEANGELLMFARPDELLRTGALRRLVEFQARYDADVVLSVGAGGAAESPWSLGDAGRSGAVTVEECPAVLLDTGVTNALFRTEHWRSVGDGDRDARVTLAKLSAGAFAVVDEQLVEPHEDEAALPLQARRSSSPQRLQERLDGLLTTTRLLSGAPRVEHLLGLARDVLPPLYAHAVAAGEPYLEVLAPAVRDVLDQLADQRSQLPLAPRLGGYVAVHGSWLDNAEVQGFLVDSASGLPVRDGATATPASLSIEVPEEWRRIEAADRRLRSRLSSVRRVGGTWELRGAAFVEYVPAGVPEVEVASTDGPWVPAAVSAAPDARWNRWAGRTWEDRADTGFTATLDSRVSQAGIVAVRVSLDGRTHVHHVEVPATPADSTGHRLDTVALVGDELVVGGSSVHRLRSGRLRGPKGITDETPVQQDDGGRFTLQLATRTELFATSVRLPAGRYALELRDEQGVRPMAWTPELLTEPPDLLDERAALTPVTVRGRAAVEVAAPLTPGDASAFQQQRWVDHVFLAARTADTRTVLLESFHGRSTGDNPGAIGAELARRSGQELPELDLVWVVDDPSVVVPDGARAVARNTRAWYEELGRARVYVANAAAPRFYRKPPGQLLLQTWHGTPLKRLAADRGPGELATWVHRRTVEAQAQTWDALLSQSAFCSEVLPPAFRFSGRVIESGYPRNDLLRSAGRDAVRQRVRSVLGITDADRVLLYAPTWRDYAGTREAKPLYLDVQLLTEALPEVVVLVRGHYNASKQRDVLRGQARVLDVTRYPDIADLLLACDVLVTDYSSVMFDFAVTDKPMALLVPDLERYRDVERGFYVDLEQSSPGPLLSSSGELLDWLRSGPEAGLALAQRRAFRARFSPWDDGRAAARVVDHLVASVDEWR